MRSPTPASAAPRGSAASASRLAATTGTRGAAPANGTAEPPVPPPPPSPGSGAGARAGVAGGGEGQGEPAGTAAHVEHGERRRRAVQLLTQHGPHHRGTRGGGPLRLHDVQPTRAPPAHP